MLPHEGITTDSILVEERGLEIRRWGRKQIAAVSVRVKNKIAFNPYAVNEGPSPEANPRRTSLVRLRKREQSLLFNRVDVSLFLVVSDGEELSVVTERYVLDSLISCL